MWFQFTQDLNTRSLIICCILFIAHVDLNQGVFDLHESIDFFIMHIALTKI